MDNTGRAFNQLTVGLSAKRSYHFTPERVEAFAALVDDQAPVHTDLKFAQAQGFNSTIVHGLFVQSILSGMLGTEIPGARSVINSLTIKMHKPVEVGQTVDYELSITALTPAVAAISLSFTASVGNLMVVSGKAICSMPNSGAT